MDGGGGECGELSRSTGLTHLPYHLRLPYTTDFTRPGLLGTEIVHEGFSKVQRHKIIKLAEAFDLIHIARI